MLLKFAEINYLAVAVAALGTFFLGALWYMPLFGKLWISLHGYTEDKMKAMQTRTPPPLFFGGMIVSYLVAALAVALIVVNLNLTQPLEGLILGFALWFIVAAVEFTGQLSSDRHYGIYAINVGFQFAYLNFMGVLLTYWRG
jgi:hypothetical protein